MGIARSTTVRWYYHRAATIPRLVPKGGIPRPERKGASGYNRHYEALDSAPSRAL